MTFDAFREFMSTGLAGYISESEPSFHSEKELKRLFMEMDQGRSHTITQSEFVSFFLGSGESSSAGKMVRMVSRSKVAEVATNAGDVGSPETDGTGAVDSTQLRVDIHEAGESLGLTSSQVVTRKKQSIWLLSAKLLEREMIKYACTPYTSAGARCERCIASTSTAYSSHAPLADGFLRQVAA